MHDEVRTFALKQRRNPKRKRTQKKNYRTFCQKRLLYFFILEKWIGLADRFRNWRVDFPPVCSENFASFYE